MFDGGADATDLVTGEVVTDEPGLIQKDQPMSFPREAVLLPLRTGRFNVGPVLLGGAQRFF